MNKFKVGDKVRTLRKSAGDRNLKFHLDRSSTTVDTIKTIEKINSSVITVLGDYFNEEDLELVEDCKPCARESVLSCGNTITSIDIGFSTGRYHADLSQIDTGFIGECNGFKIYQSKDLPINNKQTFMSKATNYIKNLTLSADEKLLRKYGFKDDCGDYTSEGVELVKAKLVKDNEDYLIEIAKGLELEAKDSK